MPNRATGNSLFEFTGLSVQSAPVNSKRRTVIFLQCTTGTGIRKTIPLTAPIGKIYVYIATTMSIAEVHSSIISTIKKRSNTTDGGGFAIPQYFSRFATVGWPTDLPSPGKRGVFRMGQLRKGSQSLKLAGHRWNLLTCPPRFFACDYVLVGVRFKNPTRLNCSTGKYRN